ncbi:MAG: DUF3800 domain-containing protein [Patescibacteria group bacterium]
MSFFRCDREIETKELKLADYDQIWSKFCFLDESGSLSNLREPLFTLGIIKISQPFYLSSKISYERSKRQFFDEVKFNKLSKNNINFAKFVVDSFLDTKSLNFYSYTLDKEGDFFKSNFAKDPWEAYEEISLALLSDAVLAHKEILILIADYITTPNSVKYEVNIKKIMNAKKGRLAMAGVCRFDSKSNDLLQVVDLLIGIIAYDLKISAGMVTGDKFKIQLVNYFKENLGVKDFVGGFKNRNFNIFVDKDFKKRLPESFTRQSIKNNEKELSS